MACENNRIESPFVKPDPLATLTFETGRSMIGFRNIFPILWEGRHLGSVEFSQPFEHLRREMHEFDPSCKYLLAI